MFTLSAQHSWSLQPGFTGMLELCQEGRISQRPDYSSSLSSGGTKI